MPAEDAQPRTGVRRGLAEVSYCCHCIHGRKKAGLRPGTGPNPVREVILLSAARLKSSTPGTLIPLKSMEDPKEFSWVLSTNTKNQNSKWS